MQCDEKTFSKEDNEYYSTDFLVKIYYLYLQYSNEKDLIPDYLENEFLDLLRYGIPEEFVVKLLYHAELQDIDRKKHIV